MFGRETVFPLSDLSEADEAALPYFPSRARRFLVEGGEAAVSVRWTFSVATADAIVPATAADQCER